MIYGNIEFPYIYDTAVLLTRSFVVATNTTICSAQAALGPKATLLSLTDTNRL